MLNAARRRGAGPADVTRALTPQPDTAPDRRWLTPREAAVRLGVSGDTVSHWRDAGHLPCFRVGRRAIRIPAAALERFEQRLGELAAERMDAARICVVKP